MNKHYKKMIAPIVITVILAVYMLLYIFVLMVLPMPLWVKLLIGLLPLAALGVCVITLIQRIKEIRSGEEDDLSQY